VPGREQFRNQRGAEVAGAARHEYLVAHHLTL
jgi:hypothetical protein